MTGSSSGEPTRVTVKAAGGTTEAAGATTATPAASPSLTVNKVLAGAGAAATTAVMGSFFGATGTVTGAALGSVVSTVVTAVYQRSLDRTKETVLQKVKLPSGASVVLRGTDAPTTVAPSTSEKVDPYATVPLQRRTTTENGSTVLVPAEQAPVPVPEEAKRRIRKRVWVPIAGAAVAFVAAMALITGIEALKGSSLSGNSGTSVSRVVSGSSASTDTTSTNQDQQRRGSTDTSSSSKPSTSSSATPSAENGSGSNSSTRSSEPSASTAPSASVEVQVPQLGGSTGSNGSPDSGGNSSGGNSSGGQDSAN
jgi:hypothetical protein